MSVPSADDWDEHWSAFAEVTKSNPAQDYRRKLICHALEDGAPPVRIIDLGSGQGDLARVLADRYPEADILGVELSERGVRLSTAKVPRAQFVCRDLTEAGEPEPHHRSWATHAVCSEVLEHVETPEQLLNNARTYLEPGATVVVTVPGGPRSAFDRHIGHRRHYTPSELRDLLDRAGLHVERVDAAGFPFFNLYRLVLILRGKALVRDVEGSQPQRAKLIMLTMQMFRWLFALNLPRSPWGWQLVARCRCPSAPSIKTKA